MVLLQVMILLGQEIGTVSSTLYKVGDLDAWGIPIDAKVYTKWPKSHSFKIGDSLCKSKYSTLLLTISNPPLKSKSLETKTVFLYPPSEDSLIQVTPSNFKSCNTKDPILSMNDGNSLFNLTQNGTLYFTSANPGHCTKYQKLLVSVGTYSAEAEALSPSSAADGPSYQNAFGSIPLSQKSSATSSLISAFSTVAASLACAVVGAIM